jgi:hypothetical protein
MKPRHLPSESKGISGPAAQKKMVVIHHAGGRRGEPVDDSGQDRHLLAGTGPIEPLSTNLALLKL